MINAQARQATKEDYVVFVLGNRQLQIEEKKDFRCNQTPDHEFHVRLESMVHRDFKSFYCLRAVDLVSLDMLWYTSIARPSHFHSIYSESSIVSRQELQDVPPELTISGLLLDKPIIAVVVAVSNSDITGQQYLDADS